METLILAVGCALGTAVAVLKLVQLLRWTRCEATFLGLPGSGLRGVGFTGQTLPIAFLLPDGTEVRATLRQYDGRAGVPAAGARFRIIYDPNEPSRVEWAASIGVVMLIGAVLAAATVAILAHWLQG